ncbi:MAG TPA: hypothetical protein VF885_05215 [Arthrobacter sp.]
MHGQITTELVEVLVTDPDRLHDLLNEAEAALLPTAIARGLEGILITRHQPGRYIVALSETVPFGETREKSLS